MAKKRRKGAKRTTRRRRVSGIGKMDFMQPIGLVLGVVAGNMVKPMLSKFLTFSGKNFSGVAVMGGGMYLKTKVTSPFMKAVSDGLTASGGITTVHEFLPMVPINGLNEIGMNSYATNGIRRRAMALNGLGGDMEVGETSYPAPKQNMAH